MSFLPRRGSRIALALGVTVLLAGGAVLGLKLTSQPPAESSAPHAPEMDPTPPTSYPLHDPHLAGAS